VARIKLWTLRIYRMSWTGGDSYKSWLVACLDRCGETALVLVFIVENIADLIYRLHFRFWKVQLQGGRKVSDLA
jgi:hypothetical protein